MELSKDETSIPLSSTKIVRLIVGSLAFVAIGVRMWVSPDLPISVRGIPVTTHGAAMACVGFFGLCAIFWIQKLFDRRPGLRLSNRGITCAFGASSFGFIPWSDIEGIDVFNMRRTRFITIKFIDPEKYLAKGGMARQMLNHANKRLCGSPVAISSGALDIAFDDLKILFDRYFAKYGRAARQQRTIRRFNNASIFPGIDRAKLG